MFGFSLGEMILLAIIALIAIGPKQLPEVARTLGRFMNELKRATGDFTRTFTDVRDDTTKTWQDARKDMNPFTASSQNYSQTVRAQPEGTVSSTGQPTAATAAAAAAAGASTAAGATEESAPKFPITPDDPFGSGHNAHAHEAPTGYEEQGSLFVSTLEAPPNSLSDDPTAPGTKEEQLAFRLTNDDGEGHT